VKLRTRWLDRKFPFDHDPGVYPCIIERLRGTPARLDELVAAIPAECLTNKRPGLWSIQELVGHLSSVEGLFDQRLTQFIAHADALIPADMTNRRTTEANYNARSIAELLAEFRRVRAASVARYEAVDDATIVHVSHHPRLDRAMRLVDMVYFLAEHDDHHLAEIVYLWRQCEVALTRKE
jgi:uncharacterized damage-inducible protein DinB